MFNFALAGLRDKFKFYVLDGPASSKTSLMWSPIPPRSVFISGNFMYLDTHIKVTIALEKNVVLNGSTTWRVVMITEM